MTVNLLQGVVEAISESDNALAGLRTTRLTVTANAGDTSITVESTLGWPDAGKIAIDGVVYRYASKTLFTLDGLTYILAGTTTPGCRVAHLAPAEVLDLSASYSALDGVRRAMLTEYAEGDDLNAVGRNLGVLRLPFVGEDADFRRIIQALAYNPKGTMFGLELALNAMLGAGNYELTEHPEKFPCTVFITLLGAANLTAVSQGKAFLAGRQTVAPTTDTALGVTGDVLAVGSVLWRDESHALDIGELADRPSALSVDEGVGSYNPWVFTGTTEVSDVLLSTIGSLEFIEFATSPVGGNFYTKTSRVQAESDAILGVQFHVEGTTTLEATPTAFARLSDTSRDIKIGFAEGTLATQVKVGLANGAAFLGTVVELNKDDTHSVVAKKRGEQYVQLEINGQWVCEVDYAAFAAGSAHEVAFGIEPGATAAGLLVHRVDLWAHTSVDFWNSRGLAGSVNSASPTVLDIGIPGHLIDPDDVGKRVRISGSAASIHPQGGNNNGFWMIGAVLSGQTASLRGPDKTDGTAQQSGARFIAFNDEATFQYPDDLGKKLVITSSATGNAKTYTIDKMYRAGSGGTPGGGVDLEGFATIIPEKTNIVELWDDLGAAPATLVVESGMTWHLEPDFVTEAGLAWEVSNTGSLSGLTATLRQALPLAAWAGRIVDVLYTDVISAQLLESEEVANSLISEVPLLFEYYPFYVADPLGFVRTYLDGITAAGVIPDFVGL